MRTAVKAYIPHVDDHVSKLQSVGVMTQNKLQNISDAATAAGIYDLHPVLNTVSTGDLPPPERTLNACSLQEA